MEKVNNMHIQMMDFCREVDNIKMKKYQKYFPYGVNRRQATTEGRVSEFENLSTKVYTV